ncbi:MAG: flagellar biosynthesis anti-sigma factor FlgM [Sphingomonadaceae bacterium]
MSPIDIRKAAPPAAAPAVHTHSSNQREAFPRTEPRPVSPGVSVEVLVGADARTPPVDQDRVAEIRAALRDGSYPLVPARIADAMIAARLALGGAV